MSQSHNASTSLNEPRQVRQWGEMGNWAPYYDFIMTLMTLGREAKLRQLTLDLCQLEPGNKVLEIGCGTGTLSLAAKDRIGTSGEICGLDLAPEMVEIAQRKARRKGVDVSFRQGSIASIPFPNDHFDAVVCSFMIFHMPDEIRQTGIAEIFRVLRSGGHFSIMDSAPLDELARSIKEHAFTDLTMQQAKFTLMQLRFLRARAQKS